MSHLSLTSTAHQTLVNMYLDAFFTRRIHSARDIHPRYETLWHEMARVSSAGKRLRPLMVMMAYEAFGGNNASSVVPAAAACELLHVSMLIHDDIIDRDLVRHGQPTIQAAYETRYAGEVANDQARHHNALGAALLSGDLLLSEARGLISRVETSAESLRLAGSAFDQAVFEVAGGELLDVESAGAPRGSVDALTVITYKTASYSFIGPLLIGAILAGAKASEQKTLRSFALNLGIAFQLTDDILGIFGNTNETGKPNDGDIHEGKATYLIERFYALASADEVTTFETYYGSPQTTLEQSELIRTLLRSSGALAETERSIRVHSDRTRADLARLNLSQEHAAVFEQLIRLCTDRVS